MQQYTIIHGDDIQGQTFELRCDSDGRYRWYDADGIDCERSGATVAEAEDELWIVAGRPSEEDWFRVETKMQYKIHLPRHGTVRYAATLDEARRLAKPEWADGWDALITSLATGERVD